MSSKIAFGNLVIKQPKVAELSQGSMLAHSKLLEHLLVQLNSDIRD